MQAQCIYIYILNKQIHLIAHCLLLIRDKEVNLRASQNNNPDYQSYRYREVVIFFCFCFNAFGGKQKRNRRCTQSRLYWESFAFLKRLTWSALATIAKAGHVRSAFTTTSILFISTSLVFRPPGNTNYYNNISTETKFV